MKFAKNRRFKEKLNGELHNVPVLTTVITQIGVDFWSLPEVNGLTLTSVH